MQPGDRVEQADLDPTDLDPHGRSSLKGTPSHLRADADCLGRTLGTGSTGSGSSLVRPRRQRRSRPGGRLRDRDCWSRHSDSDRGPDVQETAFARLRSRSGRAWGAVCRGHVGGHDGLAGRLAHRAPVSIPSLEEQGVEPACQPDAPKHETDREEGPRHIRSGREAGVVSDRQPLVGEAEDDLRGDREAR